MLGLPSAGVAQENPLLHGRLPAWGLTEAMLPRPLIFVRALAQHNALTVNSPARFINP